MENEGILQLGAVWTCMQTPQLVDPDLLRPSIVAPLTRILATCVRSIRENVEGGRAISPSRAW